MTHAICCKVQVVKSWTITLFQMSSIIFHSYVLGFVELIFSHSTVIEEAMQQIYSETESVPAGNFSHKNV